MVWPFDKKPVAPERIPMDEVIPLFDHDDNPTNRGIALEFSMIFHEVLDADKLSGALWKLLEKPGWKKLGARLRVNVLQFSVLFSIRANTDIRKG
jgi:hypothetical protein